MTCSGVEGPVARELRDFRDLPHNSLASRTSSRKKHLDKFFKIFVWSVLATDPGDFLATWLSRKNRVFCANRSIFKHFQFSLELLWLFIVFLISSLSQTHRALNPKPPLLIISPTSFSKKKVWVSIFSLYFTYIWVYFFILWDFVVFVCFAMIRTWVCLKCWIWLFGVGCSSC